ncbi:dual specificity protein phosphatase family protein [Shewanella marina]|uniref:dual specificity protein phosphatase family protein n=1 Tax=Shewanella marina TaxID=487319 RepID=UPI0004727E58|nr:dual specificity protein phosphatase family protein [Shewanella marina]
MRDVFWLVEGEIAGRSGPNKLDWDLAELYQNGFRAILSVNNADGCNVDSISQMGFAYCHQELPDNIPPQESDLSICVERLPKALKFIQEQQALGNKVLIHCRSGKDRTGLVMAYYLMCSGAAPLHAVSQVRAIRDIAFSSEGWDQFVFDVLYALQD